MNIHEYRSSDSRFILYSRTDRQTDMTKLIVVFHNSANATKKTSKATVGYKSGKGQVRFVCIPQANEVTTCSTDF